MDKSDKQSSSFNFSRRQFVSAAAGAGILGGLLPSASGSSTRLTESRTLFFNFSHHFDYPWASYYLVMGPKRYRLTALSERPEIAQYARRHSKFLAAMPFSSLTHALEHVDLPADEIQLGYVIKDPNAGSGEWQMASMHLNIPTQSYRSAYQRGLELAGAGHPIWLSMKRQKYGHPRAQSVQDFLDEQAVVDTTTHAATIIGMHPEIMNCDPDNAAHIHTNYINTGATAGLDLLLSTPAYGPAVPEITVGVPNPTGWATMVPLKDENGATMKNISNGANNGLNHYNPEWNPKLASIIGRSMGTVSKSVKSDETLGSDVTNVWTNYPPDSAIKGKIWHRKDGVTSFNQTPTRVGAVQDSVGYSFTAPSADMGYDADATVISNNDGSVTVTLSYENWFNRWLSVYLQFLDAGNNVIPVPAEIGGNGQLTALFLGPVSPALEVCGIPCFTPSKASYTFKFPKEATGVRLIAGTLGAAPHTYPGFEELGIIFTTIFNLVIPTILISIAAAAAFTPFIRLAIIPSINLVVTELLTATADLLGNVGFNNLLTIFERSLARAAPATFIYIIGALITAAAGAELINAIPIAGQIIQGIAIAGLASELGQTIGETIAGNAYYENDLILSHDVTVSLAHDPKNGNFPETATSYKVNAIPDQGKPFTQTLAITSQSPKTLPDVVFKDVPLGGKIKITTGFYSDTGWQAGHGETDLIDNVKGIQPSITLTQAIVPLGPNTVYGHKQKTALQGDSHIWVPSGAPAANPNPSCEAGRICELGNITVRQSTADTPGYVGYTWKGSSPAVSSCISGGIGELDQVANLSTGDNPQDGYVNAPCGLQPGTKLIYTLLGKSSNNFYLDSASRIVRQIELDPPLVHDPRNGNAWAMFNFSSDDLLLHPSGKLISVNNSASILEGFTLKGAVSDDEAPTKVIANVHAGPGTRPGRVSAPNSAAITPEGVVLILEEDTHRVQSMDISGNGVKYFQQQANSPYYLPLDTTKSPDTKYLDLAVEYSGYIYVLSYDVKTLLFRLDIYHPTQANGIAIATTTSFNAARITVDYWRNVYALNYEVLQNSKGFIEPGVSLWVPSTP